MINIICIIIGCVLGCCGVYLCLKPKLKNIVEINTEQIAQNKAIETENNELNSLNHYLSQKNKELSQEQEKASVTLDSLNERIKTATEQFKSLSASLEESANSMYEQSKQMAEAKMEATQLLLQKQYEEQKKQLEADYELKKNETAEKKSVLQQDIENAETRLAELTAKVQGAIEAARRQEEIESNLDYYRVVLSDDDKNEIQAFDSIRHLISNRRNLLMFEWTYYYSKRINELAVRVLGANKVTGIYKITNIETQQCYVGQSVDVRTRWREHAQKMIGIDTPSTNKFYSNALKYGIEKFTFELLETCSSAELNERERHWINFYQTSSFGLNSTKGND